MTAADTRGLRFIWISLFLDILGVGLVFPILPKLLGTFLGSDTPLASRYYGAFVATYAVMQLLFSPVLGSLSDRFGRRRVLLLSTLGQGLDYLLLAVAPSLWWLFLGRVLAGITGAGVATASAYVADISTPEKRAQNFGMLGAAAGLGFIAGPVVGGLLGQIDIRMPFFAAAALTLVNGAYGYWVLPESLPLESRRPFSWRRANPLGTLMALAKYPMLVGLTAVVFLANLAQFSLFATWVLFTSHRFGWSEVMVGTSLAAIGVSVAVVQGGLVRFIMPALGERRALVTCLLLSATAYIGYGLAPRGWMLFCLVPLNALGSLSGPAVQSLIVKAVPPTEQGMLQGGLSSLINVAQIVAPLIATQLFGYFISSRSPIAVPGMAFFAAAGMYVTASALAARHFRMHPETPHAA
jgi:MFS transporter, DHA1 family, tetracycline resistance protein